MKKAKLLLVMFLGLVFVVGCHWEKTDSGYILRENYYGVNNKGIEYLEKKYNTSCEDTSTWVANDSFSGIHNFYVKCENLISDEIFLITNERSNKEGNYTFVDNYYVLKYEQEVGELLSESLGDYLPKTTLFYNVNMGNLNRAKDTLIRVQEVSSLDDYLKKGIIYYKVAVKASDYIGRQKANTQIIKYFKSVESKVKNIDFSFEVIEDNDFNNYDGDSFVKSYGRGIGVADFVEFARISFDEEQSCYTMYWYCYKCSVQTTEKICI